MFCTGCPLLVLYLGIFPFVVLYASSASLAGLFDRLSSRKRFALQVDGVWTNIGVPYDYPAKAAG